MSWSDRGRRYTGRAMMKLPPSRCSLVRFRTSPPLSNLFVYSLSLCIIHLLCSISDAPTVLHATSPPPLLQPSQLRHIHLWPNYPSLCTSTTTSTFQLIDSSKNTKCLLPRRRSASPPSQKITLGTRTKSQRLPTVHLARN